MPDPLEDVPWLKANSIEHISRTAPFTGKRNSMPKQPMVGTVKRVAVMAIFA
jgi:hypothetical protein